MNKNLSEVHQKVQNVDFCDIGCMYGLEFAVPLTAMPMGLRYKEIRVKKIRRVGETVDINDNELERARPIHLLETLQNITKAQTQLDVCVKKGGIRQMLGLKS